MVNAQPEYDDVGRARPRRSGRPVEDVLAEAVAAAPTRPRDLPPSPAKDLSLMDLAVIALTFGAIFVVELPDKTFLAALVLSTRYRPLAVWIGVGLAFVVQTLVAVHGRRTLASFLPEDWSGAWRWLMFLVGAVLLFRDGAATPTPPRRSEEEYAAKATDAPASARPWSRRSWCCSPPSGATCRSC